MKTVIILLVFLYGSILYAQNSIRQENPNRPPNFKSGNIVSPLTDPINFFVENMVGPCVTISNVKINYTGDKKDFKNPTQLGLWNDPNNTIGISYGLILSTGDVLNAIGTADYFASINLGGPGDPLLTALSGSQTYDAIIIEFDFIPLADSIVPFEFVFASEEYPEYVGSAYNDIFGFFIGGPGYDSINNNVLTNVALVPGTNMPISINNVNANLNSNYYIDNFNGTFWVYDAYTVKFTLNVPVVANQQYHFKLALADAGDGIFDSGVVISAGSFAGNINVPAPSFTYTFNGTTVSFQNNTSGGMTYLWDFGDGTTSTEENPVHTYSDLGVYQVKLKAFNHCYENEITLTVNLLQQDISQNPIEEIQITEISKGIYKIKGQIKHPVRVFSLSGQQMNVNIQDNIIDLTNLAEGLYLLKANSSVFKVQR